MELRVDRRRRVGLILLRVDRRRIELVVLRVDWRRSGLAVVRVDWKGEAKDWRVGLVVDWRMGGARREEEVRVGGGWLELTVDWRGLPPLPPLSHDDLHDWRNWRG